MAVNVLPVNYPVARFSTKQQAWKATKRNDLMFRSFTLAGSLPVLGRAGSWLVCGATQQGRMDHAV